MQLQVEQMTYNPLHNAQSELSAWPEFELR